MRPAPIMDDIQAAIVTLHGGDRVLAREQFERIWARIRHDAEPFHECVLSHYMADARDDLAEELEWDLRALAAAEHCSQADADRLGKGMSLASFYPSLHLNLADVYRRLGDRDCALKHLAEGRAATVNLGDDPYSVLIRRGLARLTDRLKLD
jgi:hypothetical protein